jgi:hypothetical protein
MWEVFYLGSAVPYGDKKDFAEILDFLRKGHRLSKPPMCPEYIYDLMLDCWQENHLYRKTFQQLKSQLKTFDFVRQTPIIPNPNQQNNSGANNLTYTELLTADD